MVFDVIFAVQHYVLYPAPSGADHGAAAGSKDEDDKEGLLYKDNPISA